MADAREEHPLAPLNCHGDALSQRCNGRPNLTPRATASIDCHSPSEDNAMGYFQTSGSPPVTENPDNLTAMDTGTVSNINPTVETPCLTVTLPSTTPDVHISIPEVNVP